MDLIKGKYSWLLLFTSILFLLIITSNTHAMDIEIRSISNANLIVAEGEEPVEIVLAGEGLDQITLIEPFIGDELVEDFEITKGEFSGNQLTLILKAGPSTTYGCCLTLKLKIGEDTVELYTPLALAGAVPAIIERGSTLKTGQKPSSYRPPPPPPPAPCKIVSFLINKGAAKTKTRTVTLNNSAPGATRYRASELSSFNGVRWSTYSSAPQFLLSDGLGTKTVYFQVYCSSGASTVFSDRITYDNLPEQETERVMMYDVWETGTNRLELFCKEASQEFIATGEYLEEVYLDFTTSGSEYQHTVFVELQKYISGDPDKSDSWQTLKQIRKNTNGLLPPIAFQFDPAFRLTVGNIYRIQLKMSRKNNIGVTASSDAYLYNQAPRNYDLNMRVKGRRINRAPAPARPTKTALIVVLENGGVGLDSIPVLNNLPPAIPTFRCGSWEFPRKENENTLQFLARLWGMLSENAYCLQPWEWQPYILITSDWWQKISDKLLEDVSEAVRMAVDGGTPYTYDKVQVLRDSDANPSRLISTLANLSRSYIIDIHVLTHGGEKTICGKEHITVPNFFIPMKQRIVRDEMYLNLRAVYQMNCKSGTLVPDWRGLGAEVVNGTFQEYNNYMPSQYYHFMIHWLNNETFDEATSKSYEDARPYFEAIWAEEPDNVIMSKLFVTGTGTVKMTTRTK